MKETIIEFLKSKYEISDIEWRYIVLPEHEYCLCFYIVNNDIEDEYATMCTVIGNKAFTILDFIGSETDLTNEFIKYNRYNKINKLL